MFLSFKVLGEPCGQGRPIISTINGRPRGVDPARSRNYKAYVAVLAANAAKEHGWEYTEGPVLVVINAYFSVPKSKSKKYKAACYKGTELPCKKPDADNIAKIICDAMNGIVYKDDAQICELTVIKRFVCEGQEPYVSVQVFQI